MKTLIFGASVAAFTLLIAGSVPAAAQSNAPRREASRCEWQSQPQYGPRAPLRAPVCKKLGDELRGTGGPNCDPTYKGTTSGYVWRLRPQYGPKAPMQMERVWVDVEAC